MRFDTRIELIDSDAKGWKMGDSVVTNGSKATLYACGETMEITATTESKSAQSLSIIGYELSNNNFAVFAHAELNENVIAFGFIFGSSTYYNDGSYAFTLDDTAAFTEKLATFKEATVSNDFGKDFMGMLTGIGINKTRYARAYIRYNDGSILYSSDIVSVTNQEELR